MTVEGDGHRRIAARLGRPPGTVRGWLRAFARRAEAVGSPARRWAHAITPRTTGGTAGRPDRRSPTRSTRSGPRPGPAGCSWISAPRRGSWRSRSPACSTAARATRPASSCSGRSCGSHPARPHCHPAEPTAAGSSAATLARVSIAPADRRLTPAAGSATPPGAIQAKGRATEGL
jgi:hypothetical protein